ncbi:MAG TPA: hypothetical protein VF173_16765 [Thermoanaerobaculia bacterium]|nr:hypothetical protein [Thermoanaerobaculia bacterium]
MKQRGFLNLASGLLLALLLSTPGWGDEYVDPTFPQTDPTSVRGMHGCDEAHLAIGIHVGNNWLLCTSIFATSQGAGSRLVDRGTVITLGGLSMHGCPFGTVIKAIDVRDNLLVCEQANIDESRAVADSGTRRNGMHACPLGMLMKGIHVDRDILACVPVR